MRAKQINDIIHEQTEPFFKEEDFKYVKKETGYFKNVNDAKIRYGFSNIERHPQYYYQIYMYVTLNKTEEIYGKIRGTGNIGNTYVFPMSYFLDATHYVNSNPKYLIEKEEDVQPFSNRLISDYKNHVKEFIPFITQPKNMLEFLLKEIATGKAYANNIHKLMRTLILLKLSEDLRFEEKLKDFKHKLKDYTESDKKKFLLQMDNIATGKF